MKYEEAVKELDEIVKKLSSGEINMEEASKLFEMGKTLLKFCFENVKQLKGKVYEIKEELGALLEEEVELWKFQNY